MLLYSRDYRINFNEVSVKTLKERQLKREEYLSTKSPYWSVNIFVSYVEKLLNGCHQRDTETLC